MQLGSEIAQKWATYLVIAVRYERGFGRGSGRIESVLLVKDHGGWVGQPESKTVGEVVLCMMLGDTFATAIKRGDEKYYYGARVERDHRGNVTYLRTVANGVVVDNLDHLPEY